MATDPLLDDIEIALDLYGVGISKFGVAAADDASLVGRMRKGRWIKNAALREKIRQVLRRLYEKGTL